MRRSSIRHILLLATYYSVFATHYPTKEILDIANSGWSQAATVLLCVSLQAALSSADKDAIDEVLLGDSSAGMEDRHEVKIEDDGLRLDNLEVLTFHVNLR